MPSSSSSINIYKISKGKNIPSGGGRAKGLGRGPKVKLSGRDLVPFEPLSLECILIQIS
jgi:hypothetical protein